MILTMRSDVLVRSSAVNFTVLSHVEVIADVAEVTVADVILLTVVKAQTYALRRSRAVNDDERDGSYQSCKRLYRIHRPRQ